MNNTKLVTPSLALASNSGFIIGMVLFGGQGTIIGAIWGGIILFGIYQAMRFVGVIYNLIAVGAFIMVFVIFVPEGIWGILVRVGLRGFLIKLKGRK